MKQGNACGGACQAPPVALLDDRLFMLYTYQRLKEYGIAKLQWLLQYLQLYCTMLQHLLESFVVIQELRLQGTEYDTIAANVVAEIPNYEAN